MGAFHWSQLVGYIFFDDWEQRLLSVRIGLVSRLIVVN